MGKDDPGCLFFIASAGAVAVLVLWVFGSLSGFEPDYRENLNFWAISTSVGIGCLALVAVAIGFNIPVLPTPFLFAAVGAFGVAVVASTRVEATIPILPVIDVLLAVV